MTERERGEATESNELGPVSVIIPTHNRSSLLVRAITSCLSQGPACGEVIVVDDHSSDDTAQVVQSMSDTRVRYVSSPTRGAPAARNVGLRASRFDLIKFLDDDDYLLPGALAGQIEDWSTIEPAQRDRVVIYGEAIARRDESNAARSKVRRPARRKWETDLDFVLRTNILTSCPLHQKSLLNLVGGFDEDLKKGQERNLHIRLAAHGAKFIRFSRPVYVHEAFRTRQGLTNSTSHDVRFQMKYLAIRKMDELVHMAYPDRIPFRLRRRLAGTYNSCRWHAVDRHDTDIEKFCAERSDAVSPWPRILRLVASSRLLFEIEQLLRRLGYSIRSR